MSERLDRYFALEASDYLDQLEHLLQPAGKPDLDQLLRLCRGVRGSAEMGGAESVARVAERLEEGVRSVQESHVAWSEEVRQLSLRTVADLKVLVRASNQWGGMEDERVLAAIRRWEEAGPTADEEGARANPGPEPAQSAQAPARLAAETPAPAVDVATLFYDDDGPHVLTPESEEPMNQPSPPRSSQPVPIESLLLDAGGALREALALRDVVERKVRSLPGGEAELSGTLRELFELIEIAAEDGRGRG